MKDKILRTEVTEAAERLATALRKYSSGSMYCSLTILSRNENVVSEIDGESTDFYMVRVHETNHEEPVGKILMSESGQIVRDEEGRIERVSKMANGVEGC